MCVCVCVYVCVHECVCVCMYIDYSGSCLTAFLSCCLEGQQQLQIMGVGWRPCTVTTGSNFVCKLSKTLWYMDSYHAKLHSQSRNAPDQFSKYAG